MAGVTPSTKFATMHMHTKLGSFKSIDSEGRFDLRFRGTLLISQLKGTAVPSGNIRKQYDKHGRQVYFGEGQMVITGKWRAIQWFGADMSAVWYGGGVIRLSGEFDKNLNTGQYWFSDPSKKQYWLTSGVYTIPLPNPQDTKTIKPVERGKTGSGG